MLWTGAGTCRTPRAGISLSVFAPLRKGTRAPLECAHGAERGGGYIGQSCGCYHRHFLPSGLMMRLPKGPISGYSHAALRFRGQYCRILSTPRGCLSVFSHCFLLLFVLAFLASKVFAEVFCTGCEIVCDCLYEKESQSELMAEPEIFPENERLGPDRISAGGQPRLVSIQQWKCSRDRSRPDERGHSKRHRGTDQYGDRC